MKNTTLILIAFSIVSLAMCKKVETGPNANKSDIEIGKIVTNEGHRFQILTIDSCEYIALQVGANFGLLTHKGNCNNPFHCKK
jgi:hypothetical protein